MRVVIYGEDGDGGHGGVDCEHDGDGGHGDGGGEDGEDGEERGV